MKNSAGRAITRIMLYITNNCHNILYFLAVVCSSYVFSGRDHLFSTRLQLHMMLFVSHFYFRSQTFSKSTKNRYIHTHIYIFLSQFRGEKHTHIHKKTKSKQNRCNILYVNFPEISKFSKIVKNLKMCMFAMTCNQQH